MKTEYEIDWSEIVKRKTFKVAGHEVIFFVDKQHNLFVFVSFAQEDVVWLISRNSTAQVALDMLKPYDKEYARKWYYLLKKDLE